MVLPALTRFQLQFDPWPARRAKGRSSALRQTSPSRGTGCCIRSHNNNEGNLGLRDLGPLQHVDLAPEMVYGERSVRIL